MADPHLAAAAVPGERCSARSQGRVCRELREHHDGENHPFTPWAQQRAGLTCPRCGGPVNDRDDAVAHALRKDGSSACQPRQ